MLEDNKNILNIQISGENYSSLNQPFFLNDKNKKLIKNVNFNENINLLRFNEFIDFIPTRLSKLYKNINNNNIEIYLDNGLTIFNWTDLLKYYDLKKELNQINVLDFGFIYMGMGWIKVYFINLLDGKVYSRFDGGSNGYDREDNFKKICEWDGNKKIYDEILIDDLLDKNLYDDY